MIRSGVFLHVYDGCGGRRETRCATQVSGHLCACAKGELDGLADGADYQLSDYADSVPDCKFLGVFSWSSTDI